MPVQEGTCQLNPDIALVVQDGNNQQSAGDIMMNVPAESSLWTARTRVRPLPSLSLFSLFSFYLGDTDTGSGGGADLLLLR